MIKLETIRIQEFRGIRELELNLHSASFAVFGPNGSGKSGVVDAIDFALTGTVARLSGAGTGGVNLTKHGPHVHQRDNPSAAKVTLTLRHVTSGQTAELTRCVKTAGQYTLEPSTPEMVAAVEWATQHPELTLSRREVIKYVNAEPGKRAQEVQALLKLDRIDETRRVLRSALNKTTTEVKRTAVEVDQAEDRLRRHLDLSALLASEVTAAVNKHRATLGLDLLQSVTADTDLSAGSTGSPERAGFNKLSALRDVEVLSAYLAKHEDLAAAAVELAIALDELEADPTIFDALKHRQLVETGLPLVTGATCPLCDLPWADAEALRTHLMSKLVRSQAAADLERRIEQNARTVAVEVRLVRGLVGGVQPHTAMVDRMVDHAALLEWSNDLAAFEANLETLHAIRLQAGRLHSDPLAVPATLPASLAELRVAIEALPDQSATDNARTALTVAQERWGQLRQARAGAAKSGAAQRAAQAVYEIYNDVADTALTALYKTVEDDFSDFYRRLNADDESSFKAGLEPSSGKLDLEVDFMGWACSRRRHTTAKATRTAWVCACISR